MDQIAFLLLLGQSIQVINRLMVWILIQFMVISNIILLVINGLLGVDYKWKAMITFDFALLFFIVTIKVMLMVIPQSLARILSKKENGINAIINQIILVGSFQSISFLAVFVAAIYGTIIFFGIDAMIYVTCAILVVAFYYRLSGGVYKAASDKGKYYAMNRQAYRCYIQLKFYRLRGMLWHQLQDIYWMFLVPGQLQLPDILHLF